MSTRNKKPGGKPGKHKLKKQRAYLTPRQRALHRRIAEESTNTQRNPGLYRHDEVPELAALLAAALTEINARQRKARRIIFVHEGKSYAADVVGFDRVQVKDRWTGGFIAQTNIFML